MIRIGAFFSAVAFCLTSFAAEAAPLDAYGRLPQLEQIEISPDGQSLAYVTAINEARAVVIQGALDGKVVAAIKVDQKLRDLTWADSGHLLITTSFTGTARNVLSTKSEWYMTQVFDLAKKRSRALLDEVPRAMNVSLSPPQPRTVDGHTTVFVIGIGFEGSKGMPALFAIDPASGRARLVEQGTAATLNWIIDASGKLIARTAYNENTRRWSIELKQQTGWREAYGVVTPIDLPSVIGVTNDGASLIVQSQVGEAIERRPLSLNSGDFGAALGKEYGFSGAVHDPATRRIIGGRFIGVGTRYAFFDPKQETEWKRITGAFPGEEVELRSMSDDHNRVVVFVSGPQTGVAYAVVDMPTAKAFTLSVYKGLGAADLMPVRAITYPSGDGKKINAYLTLPRGKDPKGLPLVVLPHGGPGARDMPGFDWWSQALAAAGYAVLQPEFRGSEGFGRQWVEAGFGEWGRKMQSDLSDGVSALAGRGVIDPKRACIVGASYGGYAALAGVTLEHGVYRCAVSVAGPSELKDMLKWEEHQHSSNDNRLLRYWDRYMGAKTPDDPVLKEISPADFAAKVDVPVLLIHGRDDTVVPFAQTQIMADALHRAAKDVKLVALAGEDHWLSRSETRLQMLTETVAFLQANNPP